MISISPYLNFEGRTREAFEFYGEVFGAKPEFSTFGEYGMENMGMPKDGIMHVTIELGEGQVLMGSDCHPGGEPSEQNVALSGDDADKMREIFGKLAEGGKTDMPLEKQVWGDEFGMCHDKYGINWMINIPAAQ